MEEASAILFLNALLFLQLYWDDDFHTIKFTNEMHTHLSEGIYIYGCVPSL